MNEFSWMYADKNNEEALKIGESAYVIFPDGSYVYEESYDGYGHFSKYDIYALVADWNREYLSIKNIKEPEREQHEATSQSEECYINSLREYEFDCQKLVDFVNGRDNDYMEKEYGHEWKRHLGIDIACYDRDNASLKYPIKICKEKPEKWKYEELPPSNGDPNHGLKMRNEEEW